MLVIVNKILKRVAVLFISIRLITQLIIREEQRPKKMKKVTNLPRNQ